ncbi:MAG: NUDIX domain-containing protein [Chlamydiales bacterium]
MQKHVDRKEHSFGIIGLRLRDGSWEVLLVKHGKGHWGFPKGHPEPNETPQETAIRELKEETGARVKHLFDRSPLEEYYFFKSKEEGVEKRVTYFLAEVEGEISIQAHEISDYRWLSFEKAEELATFPECKLLCRQAACYFSS